MILLKDIEFTLDERSVAKAVQELNDFIRYLGNAMTILINTLAERGVEIAKANIMAFDKPAVDTGALQDSIFSAMLNKETAVVATGVMYALFVEYGTGIIGEFEHHPEPNGYGYDVNGHGVDGWVYHGTDGKFHHTLGMESRPFMYNTLRDLEIDAEKIGARVIAEYIR